MALSSVFIGLFLSIAPAEASNAVVRRGKVASSVGLEAKRTDLLLESDDMSESSTAARRDVLWQVVREVDDQLNQKSRCKLHAGTALAEKIPFVEGQASYSNLNIASARECSLMCAADSLDDRTHTNLACKSFTFNKTAHECKFFNFDHQAQGTWNNDPCCTSGPPCNLDSVRLEIQSYFHAELERMMLSQRKLANHLQTASKHLADTTTRTQQSSLASKPASASESASAKSKPPKKAEKTGTVSSKGVVAAQSLSKKTKTVASQWPYAPVSPVMPQPPMAPAQVAAPPYGAPYGTPYGAPYGAPVPSAYAAPPYTANAAPIYTAPANTPPAFPAPAYAPPAYAPPAYAPPAYAPPAYAPPAYAPPAYAPPAYAPRGYAPPANTAPAYAPPAMPAPRQPTAPVVRPAAPVQPRIPAPPVYPRTPLMGGHKGHGFFALLLGTLFTISVLVLAVVAVVNLCGAKRRGHAGEDKRTLGIDR